MEYGNLGISAAMMIASAMLCVALKGLVDRYRERKRYELTYSVLTDTSLGAWSRTGSVVGMYEGREIRDPKHLVIRIQNTGRDEFVPDDFEDPVRFHIADTVKVDRIGNMSNKNMQAVPERPTTAGVPIGFRPLMLKPGEWFDLQVFAEVHKGTSRKTSWSGRVRHVDSLKLSDDSLAIDWLPGLEYTRKSSDWGLQPSIPLSYAGLPIMALVAVIGFAAFSRTP